MRLLLVASMAIASVDGFQKRIRSDVGGTVLLVDYEGV